MEFFKIIDVQTTERELQENITVDRLEEFCADLFLLEKKQGELKVGTIWGEFSFFWLKIKGGLRMGLLDCPNALTWSITTGYPPAREGVVMHLTINRTRKKEEFIAEIGDFMQDWEEGIDRAFNKME